MQEKAVPGVTKMNGIALPERPGTLYNGKGSWPRPLEKAMETLVIAAKPARKHEPRGQRTRSAAMRGLKTREQIHRIHQILMNPCRESDPEA